LPAAQAVSTDPTPAMEHLSEAAHQSLLATIDWLRRQNVLVVAAAGNDALRRQTREGEPPPPRYPARYQAALAVAATIAGGSPASYSNRGDVPPLGNGIATFGGDIRSDADRAIGVYSAERFPDGTPNTTGLGQVGWHVVFYADRGRCSRAVMAAGHRPLTRRLDGADSRIRAAEAGQCRRFTGRARVECMAGVRVGFSELRTSS
jgi:hypothetical protein